jgi:flagellar hook-associated protein 2
MDILSTSGINNLITNYRYSERYKRIDPLEVKKNKFSNLSTQWNSLSGKLNSLQSILSDFKGSNSSSLFGSKTAELTSDEYFSASATSSASLSSYNIRVNQLAKNDLVMSDTVSSSDLSGLTAGTYTFKVASGDFDQNINIEIDGTENLEEMMELVADAINKASDGAISASVFSPTDGESKLSVAAAESGGANAITIQDVSGSLLSNIGLDLTSRTLSTGNSGGYSYTSDELNSKLSLNGVNIVRDSNTISDLINGITISLKKEMEIGVPTVNVTVKNNIEATKSDIEDFISSFNEAYMQIKNNYTSSEDGKRGIFVGNTSAISLMQNLGSIVSNKVDGIEEGKLSYLSEIGIKFDPTNGLSISDSDELEEALQSNPNQVAGIFNSENGIANSLYDLVENYVGDSGVIKNMVSAYDKSVTYYNDKITYQEERIDKSASILRGQYEKLQLQLAALSEMQSYFNMAGIF